MPKFVAPGFRYVVAHGGLVEGQRGRRSTGGPGILYRETVGKAVDDTIGFGSHGMRTGSSF